MAKSGGKRNQSERMTLRSWLFVALCAIVGAGVAWLVATLALEKGIAPFWRWFLVIAGMAVLAASLYRQGLLPWKPKKKNGSDVADKSLGFLEVTGQFVGFASALLGMISPTTVVESRPGAIEAEARKANAQLVAVRKSSDAIARQLGADGNSVARKSVPGIWGEPGCTMTYRFQIREKALIIESVKSPPGMNPYRAIGTIEAEQGNLLKTSTVSNGADKGVAAEFRYDSNGVVESLYWHDKSREMAIRLQRCDARG
jgi:hypothetical protein